MRIGGICTPCTEHLDDDMLELNIYTQYYPTDMHYFLKFSWIIMDDPL